MYRLAVVTPDPESDPTSAALLATRRADARVEWLDVGELCLSMGDSVCWSRRGEPMAYDALLLRSLNPDRSLEIQFELLELLERRGSLLINAPRSLSLAESKLQTTAVLAEAGIPVPRTVLVQDLEQALRCVRRLGRAVLKPVHGALGVGVERVEAGVDRDWLARRLEAGRALYIQEYLPNDGSDLRALVVGERVVAAMRRVAAPGEWRANVARGGRGVPVTLSDEVARLAVGAARALGLEYAGVDLMEGPSGPIVIELNGAPGWLGLEAVTGCDVPGAILDHVVSRLRG